MCQSGRQVFAGGNVLSRGARTLLHFAGAIAAGWKWPSLCSVVCVLNPIASRLEHYMNLLAGRQRLVAANIANADTPGYKTKDLDFQYEYMSLTKGAAPHVIDAPGLATKNDGNNVSIERETRLLAENAIRFNLASNLLRSQVRAVRSAIQEGKNG